MTTGTGIVILSTSGYAEVASGPECIASPGVCITSNITTGADAVVGAGAAITKDADPGVTVAGVPARPL